MEVAQVFNQIPALWLAITSFYPERDSRGCGFISVQQETSKTHLTTLKTLLLVRFSDYILNAECIQTSVNKSISNRGGTYHETCCFNIDKAR